MPYIICKNCHKEFHKPKSSVAQYCSKACWYPVHAIKMKGNKRWDSEKSIATRFKKGHKYFGDKGIYSPYWKGGKIGGHVWNSWRKRVLKRDGRTCQKCGSIGDIAHHIKHYRDYPELKFVVSNGLTVCRKCHPTYHQ